MTGVNIKKTDKLKFYFSFYCSKQIYIIPTISISYCDKFHSKTLRFFYTIDFCFLSWYFRIDIVKHRKYEEIKRFN